MDTQATKAAVRNACAAFATGHRLGMISEDMPDPIHQATTRYKTIAEQEAYKLGVAAGYERATGDVNRSLAKSLADALHMETPGEVVARRAIDFMLKQEAKGEPVETLRAVGIALARAGVLYLQEGGEIFVTPPAAAIQALADEVALLKAQLVAAGKPKEFCISGPGLLTAHEAVYNATLALDDAGVPDTIHRGVMNPHAIAQRIQTLVAQRDEALAKPQGVSAND